MCNLNPKPLLKPLTVQVATARIYSCAINKVTSCWYATFCYIQSWNKTKVLLKIEGLADKRPFFSITDSSSKHIRGQRPLVGNFGCLLILFFSIFLFSFLVSPILSQRSVFFSRSSALTHINRFNDYSVNI